MTLAPRRDLWVLQEDLTALSDDVAKLGNTPDDQSIREARNRIKRVRTDLEKLALSLGSESPGPIVEMADTVIEPVEDLLGAHPITTIALGFGLGVVVGVVWRRH